MNTRTVPASPLSGLIRIYADLEQRLSSADWLPGAALLAARLWLAKFFFFSGLTKLASWTTTIALFSDEYKVPVLPPEIAALMATAAELSLPVLLVLGLLTRFAAAGLFVMTTVIAVFVYPDAPENVYILLLSAVLVATGSGRFGADYWIARKA
ncbi:MULTISPECIES: DoxX family protein [Asticcacaulis]|uniref:DoxX family protein n=1 Tax=Asticcacaulis TaxID=76890 RepID=UPI001AE97E79|nr:MULTISPECIES: DoxX family protein [Asticcacaulis]MBP2157683.1 putative oxidoreductase [Asticcacaulis solisilvae]MDR6798728.1 putative oxidoreductase [Asticcacaulis sp. BE141]